MDTGSLSAQTPAEMRRALRQRLIELRQAQAEATVAAWSADLRRHLADVLETPGVGEDEEVEQAEEEASAE